MHDLTERLSGISLPATISTSGVAFTDDVLFTHRGLSGPAALQLSSYWVPGQEIQLNLLPDLNVVSYLMQLKKSQPKAVLRTVLSEILPRALVLELQPIFWHPFANKVLADMADTDLQKLANDLQNWRLKPAATEGYRTAEVTLGGIDTNELSSKTMESRRHPGLYCIGEVVDVTGHLGGFNFQWAWSSAHAAGEVA